MKSVLPATWFRRVADSATSVFEYAGCKQACTLVGGPFALRCCAYSGRLNENSTDLAMLNYESDPNAEVMERTDNGKIGRASDPMALLTLCGVSSPSVGPTIRLAMEVVWRRQRRRY